MKCRSFGMKNKWILLLFIIYPVFATLSYNCYNNCVCHGGIQCPANYSLENRGIRIEAGKNIRTQIDCDTEKITKKTTARIDCTKIEKEFPMDLLPTMPLPEVCKLELHGCPLPQRNFKQILDNFSMKKANVLELDGSSEKVLLTKEHLEGLNNIKRMYLKSLDFTYMDEDIFSVTPNLYSLGMEMNNNLTFSSRIFQNLTRLNSLHWVQNGLKDIPDGSFKSLHSLRKLYLFHNYLRIIDEHTFFGLWNLIELYLDNNIIEKITEHALKNLTLLSAVDLSKNNLTTISSNIFKENKKIKTIKMTLNTKLIPPDYLFANLESIQFVYLRICNLSFIPEHIFENSTTLSEVYLDANRLEYLPPMLFRGLVNLKILNLSKNFVTAIEGHVFKDLRNLETLFLQKNRISMIDANAFSNKIRLGKIDLSHNRGTDSFFDILFKAENLEKVYLHHNLIENAPDYLFSENLNLKDVDLRNNNITKLKITPSQLLRSIDMKFNNNTITTVQFEDVDKGFNPGVLTMSLAYNPIKCDCHAYKLLQLVKRTINNDKTNMFHVSHENIKCDSPSKFKDHNFTDLVPTQLTCTSEEDPLCPKMCDCAYNPKSNSVIMDCSHRNLTEFPVIGDKSVTLFTFNQTEMHLEGNYLKEGPRDLQGYDNITELYLSRNKIRSIQWLPPKLKVLHLDSNELSFLDHRILKALNASTLYNLTLGSNPWNCDCRMIDLIKILSPSKPFDVRNVICHNTSTRLINLTEEELCPNLILLVLVPLLLIFLCFSIFLVLFFRFQKPIKIWLFAHEFCSCWVDEEDLDKEKIYDAFISYSHKDEDFLVQNLLPVLEGGRNPYKLCLHQRDFIPGLLITTQITRSVEESRRTLVILSPNFLESVWSKMEFRTAHTHAMSEGRTRVIIVLCGEVDVERLDEELKSYLRTNTYVKWGDPYFWNKLKYALPHRRNLPKNSRKMTNVMTCIDEKFTLVVPDKSSPGGTLSVDALNKHPFELVPRDEVDTPPAEGGSLVVSVYS